MTIIPENDLLVKWNEKKRRNLKIANKMLDAGFEERGKRMRFCGTFLTKSKCPDCGKSVISSANLCRDRLCPTCAWRLSLRRFADMCATMQYLQDVSYYDAGFLTLTVKNCKPENLRYTLQKMSEDWNRMLCQRVVKGMVWGWARSLEITYNARTNTFHPHYHVIMITNTHGEGQAVLQQFFRERWKLSTRLPYEPITDFRFIDSDGREHNDIDDDTFTNAILETYKYSVKSDELENMPLDTFRQFVAAISGIRFCSFGGEIKKARKQLGYKDADDDGEQESPQINCECGAEMVQELLQWSFTEKQYKTLRQMLAAG